MYPLISLVGVYNVFCIGDKIVVTATSTVVSASRTLFIPVSVYMYRLSGVNAVLDMHVKCYSKVFTFILFYHQPLSKDDVT